MLAVVLGRRSSRRQTANSFETLHLKSEDCGGLRTGEGFKILNHNSSSRIKETLAVVLGQLRRAAAALEQAANNLLKVS